MSKSKKSRNILPKLKKITKNKKYHYKLKDPFSKRKLAIKEGVETESRNENKSLREAAISKKGRLNILRIYRRNKKIDECKTITKDMRWMNKEYRLGKTNNICGKK